MSKPIETANENFDRFIANLDEFIPGIQKIYEDGYDQDALAWYVNVWGDVLYVQDFRDALCGEGDNDVHL